MDIFPPRLVLCPTDFSPLATLALRYGANLAACAEPRGRVLALHADPLEAPPYFTARQEEDLASEIERSRQAAQHFLEEHVRETVDLPVPVESQVVQGAPVPAILRVARERGADLIALGTHGRSGMSHLMLGSVAERILAEAPCPVLTVRERAASGEPRAFAVERLICPVDFSEVSLLALGQAATVARCFRAELLAVHVAEVRGSQPPTGEEAGRLCDWIPEAVRVSCSLKEVVRRGNPAEQIIGLAAESRADLIVLGAQHRRFLDTTVLGTTVVRVTRHAPCPVLTVVRR